MSKLRRNTGLQIAPDGVRDLAIGRTFPIRPLSQSRQAIIEAGGLIAYTRKRLLELTPSPQS
jgi:hypothetical protein